MIKPDDIPNELFAKSIEMMLRKSYTGAGLAEFLNAAIEAGVVSPPVKCMRFQGVLQRENCVPMVCVDAPKLSPQSLVTYEHWKGQVE